MSEFDDIPDGSDAALALDFALGALDGPAWRAAELRLRRDPAFAREVAAWAERLAPLAEAVAPVAASPGVWTAVEAELFRTPAAVATPRGWWSNLRLWRALAAATSVAAAAALGVLVTRPDGGGRAVPAVAAAPAVAANTLAAAMTSSDKAAVMLTATYDPAQGSVTLTPAADSRNAGLTPELWVIVGEAPPRSLGTIDLRGVRAHRIPDALRTQVRSGATLAISLEPAGGSPTGAPTGPIVATGKLAPL